MEQLSISEKFRVFDNMIEGVQVIDRTWRYLYLNKTAINHSKQSQDDLIGFTMMEKYPGIDKSPLFPMLEEVMDGGSHRIFQNKFEFPD